MASAMQSLATDKVKVSETDVYERDNAADCPKQALKFQKLSADAIAPYRASSGAAGYDICASDAGEIQPGVNRSPNPNQSAHSLHILTHAEIFHFLSITFPLAHLPMSLGRLHTHSTRTPPERTCTNTTLATFADVAPCLSVWLSRNS
tara:strand:+ start:130 stop:573 length:444 start_codon:yes stop_codon:yes gene_type:complete